MQSFQQRRRPLLRFALLLLALEAAAIWMGHPLDPRQNQLLNAKPKWECREMRARVEGRVVRGEGRTQNSEHKMQNTERRTQNIVVDGEVDAQYLPAVRCKILLRVRQVDSASASCLLPHASSSASLPYSLTAFATVRRPSLPRFPGEFNEAAYARAHGISFIGECSSADVVVRERESQMNAMLDAARNWMREKIEHTFAEDVSPIMLALLVGNTEKLERPTKNAFAQSGTSHVLAVSGMHVSIIAAMLFVLTGGKPRNILTIAFASCLLTVYVLITGFEPPATRAAIMCIVAMIGSYMQRDVDVLNIFGASVLIQLLWAPSNIYNYGFLLSGAATFSILTIGVSLRSTCAVCIVKRAKFKSAMCNVLAINLSATAGVAIPAALMFGQAPVWSILVNLAVIPLFSYALVVGFLAIICSTFSETLAHTIAWSVDATIRLSTDLVKLAANNTPLVSIQAAIVFAVGVTCAVMWLCKSTRMRGLVVRGLVSTALIVLGVFVVQSGSNTQPQLYVSPAKHGLDAIIMGNGKRRMVEIRKRYGAVIVNSE